ncbi:MAG: (d)CMP kinase [Chlamydiales bacterium]
MIVTIDGPAGTGKTTIARRLADQLGYDYFDTGAMYRAVTYKILHDKIDFKNPHQLTAFLDTFQFQISSDKDKKTYFVGIKNVTDEIRSCMVTQYVSEIAANPLVREALLRLQRDFSIGKKVIFEGRDMGTVVFPEAEVKIFLTARPSVRAERRYLELKAKNSLINEKKTMQDLLQRDYFDSTRKVSPLMRAEGAHLVDTSDLTIEQVIERLIALIQI